MAPAIAARFLGVPILILEQNAIPGRANRLLSRLSREVVVQFQESRVYFPASVRVLALGNPVRSSILAAARRRRARPASGRPFTLLVMGGSQGARSLNEALAGALEYFRSAMGDIRILHCAGPHDEAVARERLYSSGLAGCVWGFCERMDELYAEADLAVSRAGATAIAEMAACGLPAILVPYPYARDGHQDANARALLCQGACDVISDAELNGCVLAERVMALARDPERLQRMSSAMRAFARPDAAQRIALRIAQYAVTMAGRKAA